MRVAVDATPLTLASGGLARYTQELTQALAEAYPGDEYVLISDQRFAMPRAVPANEKAGGGPRNWLERRWWAWGLPRQMGRLGAEVFHGTDFAVPYLALRPSVLTMHDLSPWMDPAWHHAAGRVRRRAPLLVRFGLATMVITDSEAVRRQAMEYFGIPASRIVAVPLAASARFQPVAPPAADNPYFLFVGTLEPRKNVPALLAAWREVRRRHSIDLVLAGRRRADFAALEAEPGLRVLGEVPDDELPGLYSGALAFVYPSLYEGFGLPVLEAMQCGACVITSRDPAIAEVAGDDAIQVDAGELAQAMRAVVEKPEMAREMRERAVRRAAGFSWARTARRTHEVYEEACRRFRH